MNAQLALAADREDFIGRDLWQAVGRRLGDVEAVVFTGPDARPGDRHADDGLMIRSVGMRHPHADLIERWSRRPGALRRRSLALHFRHTPEFGAAIVRSAQRSPAVIAAGWAAAPALQLHTAAPLILHAVDAEPEGDEAEDPISVAAAALELRAVRAAHLIICHSERQRSHLRRLGAPDARLLQVPAYGAGTPFVEPARRAARRSADLAPQLLVLSRDEAEGTRAEEHLEQIRAALPGVRILGTGGPDPSGVVLGIATAALVLDAGPSLRDDVVSAAQSGVPLLGDPAALCDAGLDPHRHGWPIDVDGDLAAQILPVLEADVGERVTAAESIVRPHTADTVADALLEDRRFRSLLEWGAPSRRRRRPLVHLS